MAAGTGIALVPEAVLATFQGPPVLKHRLAAVYANVVTPLVWRSGEVPAALAALHNELRARRGDSSRGRKAGASQ